MNLSVSNLTDDRKWRAITGFTETQFNLLLAEFEKTYLERFKQTIQQRTARSPNQPNLTTYSDLLLFTLFSLKTGLTYDALGFVAGMDGSNAKRNQSLGIMILSQTLCDLGLLPKRQFQSVAEFEAYFAQHHTLILDGTEQRIQRPGDDEEQRANYSGKKKHIRLRS
jgi:hypothetical protein